jgi:hypothetical protein
MRYIAMTLNCPKWHALLEIYPCFPDGPYQDISDRDERIKVMACILEDLGGDFFGHEKYNGLSFS